MKIIFFGNSPFSIVSLENLIKNFEVVAIVTAPDKFLGRGMKEQRVNPIKQIAENHGIPVLQPIKVKNNNLLIEELSNFDADLQVVVSYGKILPQEIIELTKFHTINLHASLLPKLRGAAPIQYALWQGLSQTGCSVQYINNKMDEGDIIGQMIVNIDIEDDYFSLEEKLAKEGAILLVECIVKIKNHTDIRKTQNHQNATYTTLINKDDGAIFFSMTPEEIMCAFRALKRYPGIYFPSKYGNIKILSCSIYSETEHDNPFGEVIAIIPEGIVISCKSGALLVETMQVPNRRPLSGKDFANGHGLKVKSMLQ